MHSLKVYKLKKTESLLVKKVKSYELIDLIENVR